MGIQGIGGIEDISGFLSDGVNLGGDATSTAFSTANSQMKQIEETAAMQMKFQTEMGLIQMMLKMNEALAKMFKSLGEAIKNLA